MGLAKQDSADTTKSRIQLPELVSGVVETLRPLAHEKQIVIEHDVPAGVVTANAPAVTQILQALLDNAVKYAPLTSEVAVTGSHTSARTIISVTDTGPGIAPEHRVKVFDRFYRVDESRSSQHVEGSGLGLSIAKSIADRHGYEIGVESEPGSGSTFTLMIPK